MEDPAPDRSFLGWVLGGGAAILLTLLNWLFSSGRWVGRQDARPSEPLGLGRPDPVQPIHLQAMEDRLTAHFDLKMQQLQVDVRHDVRSIFANEKAERYLNHEDRLRQLEGGSRRPSREDGA